jgi:hypothetical protein
MGQGGSGDELQPEGLGEAWIMVGPWREQALPSHLRDVQASIQVAGRLDSKESKVEIKSRT